MTTPTFQPTGSGHPGAGDSEASSALASPVRRRALCFGAAALGAAALAPVGLVRAQSLGDRPLRIILPLSAGSGADGAIRAISNSLAKALGQPVVMDYKAGAGGTEACDWASMLLRQYLKYAERKGFKATVEEETAGDVAGIKSATIKIEGEYAYGLLRTETGVHRLVRKSPFDSSGGRHTSFASLFVYPEIDDSIEININPADVRTDTYRASGAGGQHINKTDSAVRLTHIPTGIVVQCQDGRSQHSNRDVAWQRLRSRLYDYEMRKRQEEQQKLEDTKTDVGWGHQIRSYVLDNSRIKDLRTNVEVSATQKVLDGDLDVFIEASLKQGV